MRNLLLAAVLLTLASSAFSVPPNVCKRGGKTIITSDSCEALGAVQAPMRLTIPVDRIVSSEASSVRSPPPEPTRVAPPISNAQRPQVFVPPAQRVVRQEPHVRPNAGQILNDSLKKALLQPWVLWTFAVLIALRIFTSRSRSRKPKNFDGPLFSVRNEALSSSSGTFSKRARAEPIFGSGANGTGADSFPETRTDHALEEAWATSEPDEELPYEAAPVMSRYESEFFGLLTKALPEFDVFPQVPLAAFIRIDRKRAGRSYFWNSYRWQNRISQQRVDYLVCRKGTSSVVAAVELDDPSHESEDARRRDLKKDQSLREAGVRLVRWRVESPPNQEEIRAEFDVTVANDEGAAFCPT